MLVLYWTTAEFVLTFAGYDVTSLNAAALTAATVIVVGGAILLYLLPAIIAEARKHEHRTPILLLDLFLGWTFHADDGAVIP